MMNLTLRQLRYIDALARHRRFSRAADACAISQPALSMQIKELEDAVGTPLFERTAKQVQLTSFGEDFVRRAQRVLRSVGELEEFASAAREGRGFRLRLGMIPTVAPYLLPAVLRHVGHALPELSVDVRESITVRLVDEITDGRLDAAVVALPLSQPGLTEVALFVEPFLLVRQAADAGLPVPTRAELGRMRLLLLEEGHCFRDQALSFCDSRGDADGDGLDGTSLNTLVQLVAAGLGVTLLPEMAVAVEARSAALSICRFAPPAPERTIGMVWRRTSPFARQMAQIAALVASAHRELAADRAALV